MRKTAVITAVIVALGCASVVVAKDRTKGAIAARKAAFTLIATNFGPMGAMAKDKMPFNHEAFTMRAANLEMLAKMPWEFFIPGSEKGRTHAKPEVWSKADDYKKKADEFQQEVAKLAEVSKGDDKKAMFAQVGKVGKTCKACHKEYKEKD